jgi:hypothetical protein
MSSDDWSPDEALGTETDESWDEALDQQDEVQTDANDNPEGERELDTQLIVDEAEVGEIGLELDDPERMAVLDGDIDDPDGVDPFELDAKDTTPLGEEGWDLDAADRITSDRLDDPDDDRAES